MMTDHEVMLNLIGMGGYALGSLLVLLVLVLKGRWL